MELTFVQSELQKLWSWLAGKAGSVIIALIILFVGMKLSKWIMKLIRHSFDKSKLDATVTSFLSSIINILLYVLVVITAVSIMGIQVTSFVTLLGTAGVTIGLALQGSLSNFAGGVLILILKPFVVGDYIKEDTHGNEGTVTGIDIFYTRLQTVDGKMVVIPNGTLSNTSLTNLTKQEKRRLDLNIPVEYDVNLRLVKQVLEDTIQNSEYVLKEEPMDIVLDAFADSSMTMAVHVWVKTSEYWTAKWSMMEAVKYAFDEAGIVIPFNQLDVHLQKQ
jgi:small conductance mechanosensitive channel